MRLDEKNGLPAGQWVELREQITHGQEKEIRRARIRANETPEDRWGDDATVALRVFIKAWNVSDPDGNAIPLDAADAIDRMPRDVADVLLSEVASLLIGATVPNAPTPPSSDG